MSEEFVLINGHRLRTRLQGEGPLAVFGHGLLGSIEQIDEHISGFEKLRTRLRLLTYDARGHGHSEGPEDHAHYSWESLGRDMSALVEHFGEEQAIIGGGSMGAATALWVALEQPDKVRALVLIMPPPLGHEPMRGPAERQAIQVLDLLSAAVASFGIEQTIELARQMPAFAASPDEAEARARWLLSINPLALRYAIRGLLTSPYHDPEEYRRINVPTLVLAHEGDGLHPARAAQLLGDTIPAARVSIAPGPAYWRLHPEEFLSEVTSFLDAVG